MVHSPSYGLLAQRQSGCLLGNGSGFRNSHNPQLNAPIVEWLAHISDKDEMEVQFLLGVQLDQPASLRTARSGFKKGLIPLN